MDEKKWEYYVHMMNDFTEAKLCADTSVPEILEKMLPSPKTHPTTIDIGCGNCGLTNNMEILGFKCTAFDLRLPKKNINREIIVGDMHNLVEILKNKYDIVTCSNVFEHSIAPVVAMSEMKGILKKNGKLLIIIPVYNNRWIFDETHLMLLDNKQMENLSLKCDLILEKYMELGEENQKMRAFLYGRGEDVL